MIDVGLVGFGLGGRAFHAPIIHQVPGLRLAAIVQRSGNASAQVYPDAKIVRGLEELVALAKKNDRILTVYQDRRFDGDFRTVKKLFAENTLGKVQSFKTAFDRCRPQIKKESWKEKPAPGSGVFFDLGPHLVDQTLQLFGPPEQVLADLRIEREGSATDDAFDLTFYYQDGLRAYMNASTLRLDPRPHYRIQGSKGVYIKQGLDPQEALL